MNLIKLNPASLSRRIASNAMRFNNLRETRPNKLWDRADTVGPDAALVKELIDLLKSVGWEEGWAYCAGFVDGIFCLSLKQEGASAEQIKKFTKLMQLGVMNSVRAFAAVGLLDAFAEGVGSIWLAQHGATQQGHTGLLLVEPARASANISTIEANTSKDAQPGDKDREGDWITTKTFPAKGRGTLRTKGFVNLSKLCAFLNA